MGWVIAVSRFTLNPLLVYAGLHVRIRGDTCRLSRGSEPIGRMQGLYATLAGGVVSTFIGLFFGCVLLTLKSHCARLKAWGCAAVLMFELGLVLHATKTVPFNKSL